MNKLTKEQVKFFIETMTDDMYNTTQHEIAETLLSKFDECESLQEKLLAYEQAAKNPVAFVDERSAASSGICWAKSGKRELPHVTELYAAPVLPKQPELVDLSQQVEILNRILHWILKELPVPTQKATVMAIRLSSVIDIISYLEITAPAQPVIPEEKSAIHGTKDPEDIAFNNGFVAGWNCCRSEVISLNETTAQPVSEPYKLKDAVKDIRNSGVEIDADKIKAERDALNSPVIPDGWKLVPLEPTAAMFHAFNDCDYGRKSMRERYIQMIEAAPAQESE